MTSKVILSVLGASLVMGLSASALAQVKRGDNDQRNKTAYSQNDNTGNQNARRGNRGQNDQRSDTGNRQDAGNRQNDNTRNQNRAGNRGQNDRRGNTADRRNDNRRDQNRAGNRGRNDSRGHNRRHRQRVETFPTRFGPTKITLRENIVRTRKGPRKFCTVTARGPQARLVPKKRLKKIARNNCSRRAKVKISRISTFKPRRY